MFVARASNPSLLFLSNVPNFLTKVSWKDCFMNSLNKVYLQVSKFNLSNLTNTLLFRKSSFSDIINILILNATIENILSTKRFEKPFFWIKYVAINPFWTNVPFLYLLKRSENLRFVDLCRGTEVEFWFKMG